MNQETNLEQSRFHQTLTIAKAQLKQAEDAVEGKMEELIEAKKEVRENTVHSMSNLYSSDGFEALVELSQSMNPVAQIIADYEEEQRKIARLQNLIKNPYFARIDFLFDGEFEAEKVYIGRTSLTEKDTREIYVYDWRSPIASVFYRFMLGKAFYDAPCGQVEGEVTLKRQYEIENGELKYFFDTDRNINDELLRQMLSKNASPQMKAIVETIQKDQDVAIRDMENDLLMVQGVAGSGKTSIALHRAAYLMYQGLQSKLAANSILIVSPNSAFEQYISNVLPELGEENVESVVFEDMLHETLKHKKFQSKNEFLEHAVTHSRYQKIVKTSMEYKTSEKFQKILEVFLAEMPLQWLEFEDVYYKGKRIIGRQALKDWMAKRPEIPLGMKLVQLEDYVLEQIFGTVRRREDADERNRIRQKLQQVTQFDIVEMYRTIFYEDVYLETALQEAENAGEIREIWEYTRENLESGRLYYEDAIAASYLYLRIYGSSKYRNIKQIVIDEAQDYYPLQYEIFGMLFANAKFTVLGDINQTLAKKEDLSFYEQVRRILNKKKSSLITLDKSFRCTNEILKFSLQFVAHSPKIESFNRNGEEPAVTLAATKEELTGAILQEIDACKERGFRTICLICKNEKNAVRLYEALKSKTELQLIRNRKVESLEGVFVMPVYMSKGLEFDAVILCDVDAENYTDEEDRKLLYVECTRALHRLKLFCRGELSTLIKETLVENSGGPVE